MHFPLAWIAIIIPTTATLSLVGLPAFGTTLGLVGEPLRSEEFLFTSAKSKTYSTIHTLKGLVFVGHG